MRDEQVRERIPCQSRIISFFSMKNGRGHHCGGRRMQTGWPARHPPKKIAAPSIATTPLCPSSLITESFTPLLNVFHAFGGIALRVDFLASPVLYDCRATRPFPEKRANRTGASLEEWSWSSCYCSRHTDIRDDRTSLAAQAYSSTSENTPTLLLLASAVYALQCMPGMHPIHPARHSPSTQPAPRQQSAYLCTSEQTCILITSRMGLL